MNFKFPRHVPWFRAHPNKDTSTVISTDALMEAPKHEASFDIRFWRWSLFSLIPWAISHRDKIQIPTTVNKELKRHMRPRGQVDYSAQYSTIRFRPYVSKVPWHTGPRAFLSQLFPRYGHYCGPNWSSGKDKGSLIWDKRPIDWLDFCCYCHDMGYDTHDQAELLKADIAFLECLERPHMNVKGDPSIAHLYKTMCTSGLRNILIPYRQHLVKLQSRKLLFQFGWLVDMKWKVWNVYKT